MLHQRDDVRDDLLDSVFSSQDLNVSMDKYTMPDGEHEARHAFQVVKDELMLDGNSRQNLATFCQTWLEPEVPAHGPGIDKNMIDKDEYPADRRARGAVRPHARRPVELARGGEHDRNLDDRLQRGRDARRHGAAVEVAAAAPVGADKPADRPNLVTGPVQICWHKFTRYWDVEHREIPMDGDRLIMTPEEVLKRGRREHHRRSPHPRRDVHLPVRAGAGGRQALDQLQAEQPGSTCRSTWTAPAAASSRRSSTPDLVWDFRLPRVKSINTSGHKFGLAPLGVGWVIWRDKEDLPDDLIFNVNYLGGNMPTFALNFSRPGGQIVAQYYNFLRLGREGYRKIHQACYRHREVPRGRDRRARPVRDHLRRDPARGIPCVVVEADATGPLPRSPSSTSPTGCGPAAGRCPPTRCPPNREDLAVQRILVRQGFSRDLGELLLGDYRDALAHFDVHPVTSPMTEREAGSFHH